MKKRLHEIEDKLSLLRHQLKTYEEYVSSVDIKDGYQTGTDISKEIFELEVERKKLIRSSS